jgi:hypothetical protein
MHHESDDFFIENEEVLSRESTLRRKTAAKQHSFTSHDAWRHFNEGVVRRHYMLQSSRLFLCDRCHPQRTEPLSVYEATDCAIHLNAYYLNLRGTLDNLAWVLQYEWGLLGDVTEEDRRRRKNVPSRQDCILFGPRFLKALNARHAALASVLEQHLTWWEKELPNLRDPAAHRVPIYVPPTVATSQEQADEIKRILAQADAVPSGGSQRSFTELYLEAQAVADFKPIMVLSTRQGWTYRLIHGQVRADHDKYLAITSAIVDAL